MTNAIEQAKREMYEALRIVRQCFGSLPISKFESALESYLEQVRQDHEALHETARKRFEDVQALEVANKELQRRNDNQCESIRMLQAANISQKMQNENQRIIIEESVGTNELRDRLAAMTQDRDDCQRRMQAIDHAYNEQQKKTGTCGQVCGDRGASEQPDANTMAILGVVVDCQQLVSDWAVYGYRAKKQMKKMAYVLNNNPELRAALDHFEGRDKA